MLTVQPMPAGIEAPQVVAGINAKSAAAPMADVKVTAALVNATAVVPLLVRVTACAAVGVPTADEVNDNEAGATVNGASVLPVRLTICGALPAPERERFAVSVAVPDGV